jgi:FkbM family methyltransferase
MRKLIFLIFKVIIKALSGKKLGKIPGILAIYRIIYKIVRPNGIILITCQGNKMYVNTKDEGIVPSLLIKGVYEEYQTELFKKSIRPGMIVVDVGANVGYYTLIAAKLVKDYGRVYAFEPEPRNYELLVKNIQINGYTNVIPLQKAVSNVSGKVKLFLDKVNLGKHSLSQNNVRKAGFVEVEAVTLDDFFINIVKNVKVDFIKIDVEGAEGLVIEGADRILRDNDNLKIMMEFWPYGLRNVGTHPLMLLERLKSYGFKIKIIDEVKHRVRRVEMEEIMEISRKFKYPILSLLLEKEKA